jgi:hypothetical protein
LVQARIKVDDLDYASALTALAAAADRLPCGAAGATSDEIYELFFLQGFMHFNDGDEAGAKTSFARAAAIDRTREWPKQYPPTAKTVYLEALQAALGGDPAPLKVEITSLIVDGVQADASDPPALVEGGHLVVIDDRAVWVTVPPRGERPKSGLILTTGARLLTGIVSGNRTYAPWLTACLSELGAESFLIITTGAPRLFRDGRFQTPAPLVEASSAPQAGAPTPLPGIVIAGAGGGLSAVGLVLHLQAYEEGDLDDMGGVDVLEADYAGLLARNRAGFGLALTGGALVGTGIVVAIVSSVSGSPTAAVPWIAPTRSGVAFGLAGRF